MERLVSAGTRGVSPHSHMYDHSASAAYHSDGPEREGKELKQSGISNIVVLQGSDFKYCVLVDGTYLPTFLPRYL